MSRPLALLIDCHARGEACALVTLVGIDGAAPRRIGAQMAVSAGGEIAGSFSGGCLDWSVVEEAQAAMAAGISRRVRYGADSPYVDIVLPCGSGLDLQIDGVVPAETVNQIAQALTRRESFDLHWHHNGQAPVCLMPSATTAGGIRVHLVPAMRLVLAGAGDTLSAMCRLARAAGIDTIALTPERALQPALETLGVHVHLLQAQHTLPALAWDRHTAAITLFHDHDWELPFLTRALASDAFLVGAMGSPRAHAQRRERLHAHGVDEHALDRLRGPLGLLPRAREPEELAVSILAEAMQAYRDVAYPAPALVAVPAPAATLISAASA